MYSYQSTIVNIQSDFQSAVPVCLCFLGLADINWAVLLSSHLCRSLSRGVLKPFCPVCQKVLQYHKLSPYQEVQYYCSQLCDEI